MDKVNLNNYVCIKPFTNLEVHQNSHFLCCGSWLLKHLPKHTSSKAAWESIEADEIRNTMLDGSYKYCDKSECPYLKQIINHGEIGNIAPFYHKNNLPKDIDDTINLFLTKKTFKPSMIHFSFDHTCNLKCPSCRVDLIIENSSGIERVKKTIQEIEIEFGSTTKTLLITGSGDPFISVGFRDFLKTFDKSKWPILNKIHLHTNATKWNKKMWDSMSNVHKYIKSCEISIDAATKDTYETKVRLGGKWDELIENLKFINTIPSLKNIKTSFVVQKKNYKEMKMFYDLMLSIFGKKVNVYFGRINNWGTFSNEQYLNEKVWDVSHPDYNDFVNEVKSFLPSDQVWHNLHEFISDKKTLI